MRRSVKSGSISKAKKARMTRKRRFGRKTRTIARVAKRVLASQAESKLVSQQMNEQFNYTISSASECYPLVPQISEGDGGNQRVGNKVSPRYLIVRGTVQISNSFIATQKELPPSTIRVMILSQKNVKVGTECKTKCDTAHLLKDNNGTDVARPYTGGPFDNMAPINTELFRVHMDRKFKFNWQNYQDTSQGGMPSVTWQTGNDRTKTFYVKIKCPKTLTFDDGNQDWPNNFAPFICVGGVCDDGQSPFTANTPLWVRAQSLLYYKDL